MSNFIKELSPHLNVITGANGSGKTRLLEKLKASRTNSEFIDNCGCDLSQIELEKYAEELKEKSQHKQIIVVSNQKEIIDIADKLIEL